MSINQYTMNSLLLNQKVKKRRRQKPEARNALPRNTSHNDSKKAFRPKGIISLFEKNVKLIDAVRQNPARVYHQTAYHQPQESFSPQYKSVSREEAFSDAFEKKRTPLFTTPALPIAALFLLSIGIAFAVYGPHALDWIERETVSSAKDSGSEYSLARYAGVNPLDAHLASPSANEASSNSENIPLDMTETFAWQDYKVKKGDSVSKIAAAFSVSMDAIISSNGITNARSLREGETLRIPNMDGIPYVVKSGDSLAKISQSMGVPLEAILDANDIQSDVINAGTTLFIPGARMNKDDLALALGELFIYPLKGSRLSSPFGWRNDPFTGERRHHAAIDLSAPQGTVVWAAMDGKVSTLGYDRTYGNFIILTHAGGYQTMYAHLFSITVKKGDTVSKGKQIGTVGNTGYSTGPHLHFAVFKNSRAVNPLDYLTSQR